MKLPILLLSLGMLCCSCSTNSLQPVFVRVENGQFIQDGKPFYFIGANFWYGALLASQGEGGDRERLTRELDAMKRSGVTNLRILVGADGPEGVVSKVSPSLQIAPGQYDNQLLDGLDYLMQQLDARGMKAVLYLNNAWEWSGGYSQYMMWAGEASAPIPAIDGGGAYMEYVKGFIPNERARVLFDEHVRFIVSRTNRYTERKYTEDPAIFSWQICNEPRAFSDENKEAFAQWIGSVARLIRSLDPNHMISTGSEGLFGCQADSALTERIHAFDEISYINLHIWPYNWRWATADVMDGSLGEGITKTGEYIDLHLEIAKKLQKPAVIEEFGFPRDGFVFERGTPTTLRDTYYKYIFERLARSQAEGGLLAGCNYWGWGGEARPARLYWQAGDPYCGDPAQEQQGLYSVFDDDTTVALIGSYTKRLQ